jgi:hypothetical protein
MLHKIQIDSFNKETLIVDKINFVIDFWCILNAFVALVTLKLYKYYQVFHYKWRKVFKSTGIIGLKLLWV